MLNTSLRSLLQVLSKLWFKNGRSYLVSINVDVWQATHLRRSDHRISKSCLFLLKSLLLLLSNLLNGFQSSLLHLLRIVVRHYDCYQNCKGKYSSCSCREVNGELSWSRSKLRFFILWGFLIVSVFKEGWLTVIVVVWVAWDIPLWEDPFRVLGLEVIVSELGLSCTSLVLIGL